ncbi:MAG: sensor histidine kinase [Hungatella sp.]|nr:sensor histidine kinase [Hungatella sp.]
MNLHTFFKTIKGKIISITIGTTLLITLVTVSVCFCVFQSLLRRNQIQSVEFNLQIAANSISSDMKDLVYFTNWCRQSTDIAGYLETFLDKDPLAIVSKDDKGLRSVAISSFDRLKEEYHNTRSSRYITRIIVSNNTSSNFLQVLPTSGDTSSYKVDSLAKSQVFQSLFASPDFHWIGIIDDPFYQKNSPSVPIIPIARPIYNTFGTDIIGWVYVSVSSNVIMDYLKSFPFPQDSRLYLTIGDKLYLIEGSVCQEMEPDFTVLSEEQVKDVDSKTVVQKVRMADGSTKTLITRSLGQTGWYLHQTLSWQQLEQQRQVYLLLIAAICAIILSLGFFMVYSLNRTISQPVARIQKKINGIAHGDFSRDDSIEWDHELGDIGRGINNLSRDVVSLMEKRIDDEKQKKDLEYQILQSQINPHFLYNTLNSIKWMATIQGAAGIAEMTTALARLLKQVAKGSSALIPLKEELDLVKNYFLIQQYRYGGSISIEYQMESEDLYQCMIHRFSLQPIVENALFHGIEPKGSAGRIQVDVRTRTDDRGKSLEISITDNGVGMTQEAIERALKQSEEKKSADFFRQVGIANVNQRIQYEFGPDYGISITSEPGVYTTMTMVIPYVAR